MRRVSSSQKLFLPVLPWASRLPLPCNPLAICHPCQACTGRWLSWRQELPASRPFSWLPKQLLSWPLRAFSWRQQPLSSSLTLKRAFSLRFFSWHPWSHHRRLKKLAVFDFLTMELVERQSAALSSFLDRLPNQKNPSASASSIWASWRGTGFRTKRSPLAVFSPTGNGWPTINPVPSRP